MAAGLIFFAKASKSIRMIRTCTLFLEWCKMKKCKRNACD